MSRRWTALLLVVLALGAAIAALAAVRLEADSPEEAEASLLYLPEGPYLRITALGQEALLADLLYLWAIQYYSAYEVSGRYRYLEAVFAEAITELDPHYEDAYWIGALIMSLEAGDPERAFRLLDKGIEKNPHSWRLLYVAGWEAYLEGAYDRARGYFDRLRRFPDAPAGTERVYAAVLEKAGDPVQALREWWLVLDESEDPYVTSVAERWIRELTVQLLEEGVGVFEERAGRRPRALAELGSAGLVPVGLLPAGWERFPYDARTGEVRAPESRVLRERR